jgi:carboxyl-terminal processing protease
MFLTKAVALVAGLVVVFRLGVAVGHGDIAFGRSAALTKSVSKDLPANLSYSSVEQLYDILRRDFDGQLSSEKLLEGLKRGLASASGDPHTEYLNPEETKDLTEDLSGTFSGIGAELSKDESGAVAVVAPIAGYPADKAGLRPKDVIAEINGESALDITVSQAVKKIRGPVGTKVKLKIVRGGREELDFEITREQISIPSVETEILDGNIGYMKVSRFAEDTTSLARKKAIEFKQRGVKGVILDLRSDPGGLLDAAVDVSSLWLPGGKTVLQEKRDGIVIRTYTSDGTATLAGIPTVVLINEGSASASEITAGALKDNKVATLMGTTSYGKGSVQKLENLSDGGVFKVTIAHWYTPGGKNIDKEGIAPDKKVERSADDIKNKRDPQKDAAVQALRK